MRTGEVFALTWDDIDLENKIIKINKTVYSKIKDDKGRWFLGTTKTKGSCREVFICDTLYKILSNYKEKQKLLKKKYGRKYKKYELEPIKNKYGKTNEYKIVENKYKNLKSVEIVFTKNNGLYEGAEIRDVADILGHSRIETTENYYISSTEKSRIETNDMLGDIIKSDVINEIMNFEKFI